MRDLFWSRYWELIQNLYHVSDVIAREYVQDRTVHDLQFRKVTLKQAGEFNKFENFVLQKICMGCNIFCCSLEMNFGNRRKIKYH